MRPPGHRGACPCGSVPSAARATAAQLSHAAGTYAGDPKSEEETTAFHYKAHSGATRSLAALPDDNPKPKPIEQARKARRDTPTTTFYYKAYSGATRSLQVVFNSRTTAT